ncbi:TonB-dependent receptor [candidate division WOR-3 bacterium]|nr:TonB-dependent receptor [candidate division WOR-3 bacterium]
MSQKLKIVLLLGSFTSLWISFAHSTELGNITGIVVERTTQHPLPGANVFIIGTQMGDATDTTGRFLIENVPVKEYSIQASMMGYKPLVKTRIYPVPRRTIVVDFALEETMLKGEGVTVTPSYFQKERDAVVSSHQISFYELRGNPESYNVQRTLASLPGIGTVQDYSAQLIVRGGDPDENLCLIDNIEIKSPVHFGWFGGEGGSISIINTALVRDIGFSSGGFPARYGDKLSSVMEIRLKEGNRNKFEANFDFNMAGVGFDIGGPMSQKGSYLFAYSKSFLELLDKISDIGKVIPKYDQIWGKLVYDVSPRDKLSLLGLKTVDRMTVPKDELGRGARSDLIWEGGQGMVGLNWRNLFSERGFSLFTLSGSSHHLDLESEGSFGVNSSQSDITPRYSVTYSISPAIELNAGASYKYLLYDWSSFSAPETTTTGDPIPADSIEKRESSYKLASYIQGSFSPVPRLTVTLGARGDYFNLTRERILSPRIGLSYALSPITSLNLAYGKFYQFPPYEYLLSSDLTAKHATHYVIGLDHLITSNTRLQIEGYRKDLSRLFSLITDTTRERDNSKTGYTQGIEFLVHKKLVEKLYGSISYSYSISKREDRWGSEYYSDWHQPHILTVIGGYKPSDRLEFTLRWRYASGRPYTPLAGVDSTLVPGKYFRINGAINSARYPSYHRLDFQVAYRHIFRGWSMVSYFNLQNIYNRRNILWYRWNNDYTERDGIYQFLFMPVGGVTIQF